MLDLLLAHGTLALLFVLLIAGGLGLPFPEDLVLLTAGALAHRGTTPLPAALVVCMVGLLIGDFLLFRTAKKLGPRAFDKRLFRRLLPQRRRHRIESLVQRHGGLIVFVARHLAGLRAPVFAMAGIHGMATAKFMVVDAIAACISAPLTVGLGYYFSANLDLVRRGLARGEHFAFFGLIALLFAYLLFVAWRRWHAGRLEGQDGHS